MAGFGRYTDIRRVGSAGSLATIYEDLQISFATAKIPGGSSATWENITLDGFATQIMALDTNDYAEIFVQTTHAVKLQTLIDNHIHWTINADDVGKKIAFTITGVGAGIGSAFTSVGTITSPDYTLVANDAKKHKFLEIGDIPATFNSTVSTCFILRLTRVAPSAGVDTGEKIYIIFNDCHVQWDTLGSLQETSKT